MNLSFVKYMRSAVATFLLLGAAMVSGLGSGQAQAQHVVWPVWYPHAGVHVQVGYGWFSPWFGVSPWYQPNWWYQNPWGSWFYPTVWQQPSWGAISWSPSTGHSGIAWGQFSQSAALNTANFQCGSADCRPVVWVAGGCAAIAVGQDSNQRSFVGWGWHFNRAQAESYALQGCAHQAQSCQVHSWVCSW